MRVAVGHHHDHRFATLGRDQIVEDEVRIALTHPAGLVLACTMLQIENWIAHVRFRIVIGRQINEGMPPGPVTFELYQASRTAPCGTSCTE